MTRRGKADPSDRTADEWYDEPQCSDPEGSVAVMRTPVGHVAFVPIAIQRLTGDALDAYGELQKATGRLHAARSSVQASVVECRELGVSWASIGWSVGTTGDACRKRWGMEAGDS